ncbi:PREDICTED: B3 domain-containing protein REM10-like [Nicotiana attenuata]|uniref:B3 domain-containing protein rem10 n=1 Tax=Nicotiana attenuata TaxID=49451 RepID=A0A314LA48_NICAT|nr:PREDICTED: B3 domain-containing protein REM10-like [Nicotiana attenuata]OIT38373.1 b3 domain-containing protein rem10 [Nicotiana attenuata]
MKIPPKKPHFLKPMLPGFKHDTKIPVGFLKYLKGYDHIEHAILKRDGKKWMVKVNGRRFEDGWAEFAEEHDLQLGDMLVFRHEGNMEFEVIIFDSSQCDREYAEYVQQEEGEVHTLEETSKNFEFKDAAIHNSVGQSYFICTVKPYCLTNGLLRIPKQFALANGLANKKCGLIIRDEKQRSWDLRLTTYGSQVYIGGRWGEFRAANDIKVGNHIMFEVVTNGEQPIWKFHDKPNPSIKSLAFPHAEPATHKPFGYSHFVCTVKPYCLSNDLLCIPRQFAHANGLINKKCDLIIRDERQRSWSLRLRSFGTGVCIKGGWHEFRDTNCLKEGDQIVFEVVTNGEKPIWQFRRNISGENASIIQEVD